MPKRVSAPVPVLIGPTSTAPVAILNRKKSPVVKSPAQNDLPFGSRFNANQESSPGASYVCTTFPAPSNRLILVLFATSKPPDPSPGGSNRTAYETPPIFAKSANCAPAPETSNRIMRPPSDV